jgi:hypothetical protein
VTVAEAAEQMTQGTINSISHREEDRS